MAYSALTVSLPSNIIEAVLEGSIAWGSDAVKSSHRTPRLVPSNLTLWSGTGSQTGLINLAHFGGTPFSGTLTNGTPGTTDTADIDLKAATDLFGTSKAYAEACVLLVLNYSTTAGNVLTVGGSSAAPPTDAWTAPFVGMADPTLGRLTVMPGHVDPVTGATVPGILLLWSGNATAFPVATNNKVLRLYSGSATSLPYRVLLAGRDAAS